MPMENPTSEGALYAICFRAGRNLRTNKMFFDGAEVSVPPFTTFGFLCSPTAEATPIRLFVLRVGYKFREFVGP